MDLPIGSGSETLKKNIFKFEGIESGFGSNLSGKKPGSESSSLIKLVLNLSEFGSGFGSYPFEKLVPDLQPCYIIFNRGDFDLDSDSTLRKNRIRITIPYNNGLNKNARFPVGGSFS